MVTLRARLLLCTATGMVSLLHEGLVDLFRRRPSLAPELLRDAIHASLPAFDRARVGDANLTELQPAELRADLVVLLEAIDGGVVVAIVIEAQLQADADKRWSWPAYLAGLRARLRCGAMLVVITADEAVARWAARPIEMGHPEFLLKPLVLGPESVPVVSDQDAAIAGPELVVLSAMVHGHGPHARDIGAAGLEAVRRLDDERAALYLDLILVSVDAAARAYLEKLMNGKYEYQSDFARRYFSQGKDAGRAEGEAAGRVAGEARALLRILEARGIEVSDALHARIASCTDVALLDTWLARAATATSAAEVIGE